METQSNIDSVIQVGDVPFFSLKERTIELWMNSKGWKQLYADIGFFQSHNIFVVSIANISIEVVKNLDQALRNNKEFLGIVEITPIHKNLYLTRLVPFGHFLDDDFFLFWDGLSEDSKYYDMVDTLKELPFREVDFEERSPLDE
ncbi:MAG: hypothetical protein ACPG8W_25870 [Candidatus Promineifilaceae bacterium]